MTDNNVNSIVRIHKNTNYSVMNNEFLHRKDMSWKAKGILAYCLSMPDDWNFYLKELEKHSSDGKSSLRSGWEELRELGYVIYEVIRDGGKIREHRYNVGESPFTDFQQVENQEVENQTLLNTNNILSTNILNTNISNRYIYIGENDDDENIYNFIENNLGITISPIEFEKINTWLDIFSEDVIKHAIELSCLNNVKKLNYVLAILNDWNKRKFKSLEEITSQGFKSKQNESLKDHPWFNKEIVKTEANQEERQELEDLLSEFK